MTNQGQTLTKFVTSRRSQEASVSDIRNWNFVIYSGADIAFAGIEIEVVDTDKLTRDAVDFAD